MAAGPTINWAKRISKKIFHFGFSISDNKSLLLLLLLLLSSYQRLAFIIILHYDQATRILIVCFHCSLYTVLEHLKTLIVARAKSGVTSASLLHIAIINQTTVQCFVLNLVYFLLFVINLACAVWSKCDTQSSILHFHCLKS